jgi:hypothetical protein
LFAGCSFVIHVNAQVKDSTAVADSVLLKQIEQQMQNDQPTPAKTRSAISSNPDIGVVGDFQLSYKSNERRKFDAYLNEAEVSFQAVVDPYIRADFFVSFGRDEVTNKYGVDIEEAYLTTLSLPARLQLRAGKFKGAVGKINPVHAHALPFIDLPNAYENLFGEGLADEGISLSWLLPNKKFYQELVVQATSGREESPSFMKSETGRFLYLGHLKNFFTLSDNATLEAGITGITGPNDSARITNIGAFDLTYKWKPVRMNTYRSLTWQSEIFYSHANRTDTTTSKSLGLYSFLTYQIAKRWFLTGRYDYAERPFDKTIVEQAFSLSAGWYATEFSKMEIEFKTTDDNIQSRYYQGWLRWIFVIGAHGAHQY